MQSAGGCRGLGLSRWCFGRLESKVVLALFARNVDGVATSKFTAQQIFRQGVLDKLRQSSAQWPCTKVRVVSAIDQEILGQLIDLHGHALLGQSLSQFGQLEVDDVIQIILHQRSKDDDFVKPVDELRAEELLHLAGESLLHLLVVLHFGPFGKAKVASALNDIGTQVAGHDDDAVSKVDVSAE